MRFLSVLTGILSQSHLQPRDDASPSLQTLEERRTDSTSPPRLLSERQEGQYYTQVYQTTTWGQTPTYIVTYNSVTIVTLTSWVPCPVTTSYTTIYKCSSCGGGGAWGAPTTCAPKLCSTQINDVVIATTTPYSPGETAQAYVTNNNGVSYTTTIPGNLCSAYITYANLQNYDCGANSLPACGPGTTTTPVPVGLTCQAKPCTVLEGLNGPNTYATLTYATGYQFTEYAPLTVNGYATSTPATLCAALTSPIDGVFACPPSVSCGDEQSGIITPTPTTDYVAGQVITYTYTTHGSTIVVVTTIPTHDGPFRLTGPGNGAGRISGDRGWIVGVVGVVIGVVAGGGMVLL
jgi:hypothetical protein